MGVTDDALHLYLFPYSLTHYATAWFDRFLRNSITTFEQIEKMFLGKYFPPSMVTKLRNEITNFRQRLDELLFEACERYKLSIDRCPNHNMLPVTQIDTFYNMLTLRYHDTINATAGGTFMKRRPKECYDLIKKMTAHHKDWDTSVQRSESSSSITSPFNPEIVALKDEMAKINKNLIKVLQINQQVKAFTPRCETCGGPHSYNDSYQALAYQAPAYQASGYQASVHQASIPQLHVVTTTEFTNYMKANDAILKNMQTNMTSLTNSNLELNNMFGQFMKMNTASYLGSGTRPSNTITNSKKDLEGITTRSGNAYKGPTIPTTSSLPKVVERETEVTKDTVPPTNNESTKNVQPPIVQIETPIPNSEPVVAPVAEPVVAPFGPTIKSFLTNKDKLFELARTPLNEHCSAVLLKKLPEKLGDLGKFLIPCDFSGMNECLALADLGSSINHMPLSVWNKLSFPNGLLLVDFDADPRVSLILGRSCLKTGRALIDVYEGELTLRIGNKAITFNLDQTTRYSVNYDVIGNPTPSTELIVSNSSLTLTPFGDSDFLLEETDAFMAIDDVPISPEINESYYDSEGDILLLEEFLNDDPSSLPLPPQELKVVEPTNEKSFINEPPVVELKDLPSHLEYTFLEGDDKLPVIIAKDLKDKEKTALIKDDFKPAVYHQRRVNLKIHEVIKKEVLELLDAGLIYPISDSPWVSPMHCVPKKGGFTVDENEENELIPTRLVTGWRVCIDYRKLND
nr:DNA-directed DNA polymerase [Tanacetum cinerariifolium]